jgi:hypothetical protein
MRKTNTGRMFLTQLSKVLTDLQNQLRRQESRLMSKVKLVLLSLGYNLRSEGVKDLSVNTQPNPTKKDAICVQHIPDEKIDKHVIIVDKMFVFLILTASKWLIVRCVKKKIKKDFAFTKEIQM